MLSDIEVAKQSIELVTCTHIIIVLQHVQRKTLTEPARADEKEESVRLFYYMDERGFIHVIIIIKTNIRKVHHAVWQQLSF